MATALADKPKAEQVALNDYAEDIDRLESLLEMALEKRRYAQSEIQVAQANMAVQQFRDGLAVLKDAATIPATLTQFGTPVSQEWSLLIPPAGIPEFRNQPGLRVKAYDYVVVTKDPVQIAYLRRAVERKSLEGLIEMEPGLRCGISKDGDFFDWLKPETYQKYVATGSGRGW